MAFIVVMLALDLGVFHKKDHVISNKEAATWTLVWVLLAMGFAVLLWFKAEWIHGISNMEDLLAYVGNSDLSKVIKEGMDYAESLSIYRKASVRTRPASFAAFQLPCFRKSE